ncbi:hypothetical protein HK098_004833 [Nowakowskiella sp. JEL0407]|nr:hypothetical protein HK098_004833 [Nowakowskiella sp. JEL0407]
MDFSGSAVTIVDVYRICNEPAIYLNSPVNDSGLKIGGAILLNLNRKEYTTPSWARIREAPSNDDVNMYHSVSTDKQSVPVGISFNLAYALKLDFRFPEQLTLDVVPEVKPINYVSLKVDWVQNYRNQQRDKYLKVYEKLPEDSDSQFPNSDQLRDVLSGTLIYLDQKFLLRWLNRTLIVIVQKVLFKHNAKMKEGAPILGEITNSTKIEMEKEPLDGLLDAERPKSPDIRPKVSLTSNSTSLLGANGVVRRIELFLDDAWDGENLLGVLVTGKIGNEEVQLTRADFEKVLEWKKPSQLGEFSISVPRVTFDELFGMEDIVSQIKVRYDSIMVFTKIAKEAYRRK